MLPVIIGVCSILKMLENTAPQTDFLDLDMDNLHTDKGRLSGRAVCRCGDNNVVFDKEIPICPRCGCPRTYPEISKTAYYALQTNPDFIEERVEVVLEEYDFTTNKLSKHKMFLEPLNSMDLIVFGRVLEQAVAEGEYAGCRFEEGGDLRLATDLWIMLGQTRREAEERVGKLDISMFRPWLVGGV